MKLTGKRILASAIAVLVTAGVTILSFTKLRSGEKMIQALSQQDQGITQEDMVYFVFTDRFLNGDTKNDIEIDPDNPLGYHGGDFKGILQKLDYIKDLGFTAIWISPVMKNDPGSYHGYLGTDFYQTNPNFGTMEELKELVEEAHKKDIKVILDFVVNHTGRTHPWASDPNYYNWFHHNGTIVNWDDPKEVEDFDQDGLPDFDQSNPEVRKYLIDMAKWWINETKVDGFRLDTFRHVPRDFWVEFRKEILEVFPRFYMVGEAIYNAVFFLADYQTSTGVDGMVNYPIYYGIKDVFGIKESSAKKLAGMIESCSQTLDNEYLMGTFIDNHDVPRFIHELRFLDEKDRTAKLKQALSFMFTYTGIPILYYGTEIAMEGGPDPDNRHDMEWDKQAPMADYVRMLTGIRKTHRALTYGEIKVLGADKSFLCYSRTYQDETVITMFNTSDTEITCEVAVPDAKGRLKSLFTQKEAAITNGKVVRSLAPYEADIMIVNK